MLQLAGAIRRLTTFRDKGKVRSLLTEGKTLRFNKTSCTLGLPVLVKGPSDVNQTRELL